jgi:cbb3-type cytochrome oxidase subunit 3
LLPAFIDVNSGNNGNLLIFLNMFKNKLILIFSTLFIATGLFLFSFISAEGSYGLDATVANPTLSEAFKVSEVGSDSGGFISSRVGIIIGAALSFIGIVFMVLIIYGGLTWMLARGNDQQVEKAQKLIIQSVIGLIIVLSAYAITSFIGEQLTAPTQGVVTETE